MHAPPQLDVEKPLLKNDINAINKVLHRGLQVLVWNSQNAEKDAFIQEAHELVTAAHRTLFQMKGNMDAIIAILNKWIASPLMTRSSASKTYNMPSYMVRTAYSPAWLTSCQVHLPLTIRACRHTCRRSTLGTSRRGRRT